MLKYIVVLCLFITASCGSKSQDKNTVSKEDGLLAADEQFVEPTPLKPYKELKEDVQAKRDDFRQAYKRNNAKQDSVIDAAQKYLLNISDDFFRSWYNTPWTFEGHTETPQQGSIACGYFVTTTLRDMGFNIPRIKWAQQGSEYVVVKLSKDIKRFRNVPMTEVVDYLKNKGDGLYIVGLDNHVGYIYSRKGNIAFVHSNYYKRDIGVMSEPLIGRNPLNDSKYKVIGKIFDRDMVINWLNNSRYPQ